MEPVFLVVLTLLLVELSVALRVRAREARTLGRVVHRELAGHRYRFASVLVLAVVAAGAFLERHELGLFWSLPIIALTALVVAVIPARGDSVCGIAGARIGWRVVPMEAYEEWRLVGQHLRFRVDGRWCATPLPPDLHAQVAEELARRIPERESPYK